MAVSCHCYIQLTRESHAGNGNQGSGNGNGNGNNNGCAKSVRPPSLLPCCDDVTQLQHAYGCSIGSDAHQQLVLSLSLHFQHPIPGCMPCVCLHLTFLAHPAWA